MAARYRRPITGGLRRSKKCLRAEGLERARASNRYKGLHDHVKQSKGGTMTKRRILARLAIGFVVVMCGAFTGRSGAQTGDYCTQTADTLLDACKASVMDDGAVGKAVCINITDPKAQNACLDDLEDSQAEASQLCEGQHDTRLAACGVLGEDRYDPDFRPARFDNPRRPSNPNAYFPLGVGKHWKYRTATQVNGGCRERDQTDRGRELYRVPGSGLRGWSD